jgi:hypothetical protein
MRLRDGSTVKKADAPPRGWFYPKMISPVHKSCGTRFQCPQKEGQSPKSAMLDSFLNMYKAARFFP